MNGRRWRLRSLVWELTRNLRERILSRLRAHVARALAENFIQLADQVEATRRIGLDLIAEIRAAEMRHQTAEHRLLATEARLQGAETHLQTAEARLTAAEVAYQQTVTRYEQKLAEYQQKVGDYSQCVGDSNVLAEGMIREMVRLQQQVDELSEALDHVHDAMRPDAETPVTLKYRAAA
jgi:hypothetical protein